MEKVNLGILGVYPLENVVCDDDFDSDEEYFEFVKGIFKQYNDNLDEINRKLLYRMYDSLYSCGFPIWEEEGFKKVIDEEKLPSNFYEMNEDEKYVALYEFDFDEENIIEKLNTNVPFLNINKFKNDIRVSNVYINKNLSELSIEFEGFCNAFNAMVTFLFNDNFRISDFHAS